MRLPCRTGAATLDGWVTGDVEAALAAAGVLLAGFALPCAQHASTHGSLDGREACTIWRRQLELGASTT